MANKSRSTQADIARLAGVSQALVSYVVNNNPNVKIPEETRQRIQDAIKELEYVPNALARGLRSGQTKTIGLVVPDNSNPFFAEIARVIENLGFENGYSVILCNSDYELEKENAYVDVLLAKQADGVIFISSGGDKEISQKLQESHIPFVIVDREITGFQTDVVRMDYQLGGYLATKYLVKLGHQEIACITGSPRFLPNDQRLDGYYQALEEAGIPLNPSLVVQGDFRIQGGSVAMKHLLGLQNPPTAVFACNDLMAFGAIQVIRQNGLSIPKDISIIGYDDIPFAQAMDPSLTTVAQPVPEIAQSTMTSLLRQMKNKYPAGKPSMSRQIVIQPKLIIRESTAPRSNSNAG
jgi:LacI family transcriptional regulator